MCIRDRYIVEYNQDKFSIDFIDPSTSLIYHRLCIRCFDINEDTKDREDYVVTLLCPTEVTPYIPKNSKIVELIGKYIADKYRDVYNKDRNEIYLIADHVKLVTYKIEWSPSH